MNISIIEREVTEIEKELVLLENSSPSRLVAMRKNAAWQQIAEKQRLITKLSKILYERGKF